MPVENVDKDIEDLMDGYLKNRNEDLLALKHALESKDYSVISSICHKVKGSAGGYGLQGLGSIAVELESNSKEENHKSCSLLVEEFEKYLLELEINYL